MDNTNDTINSDSWKENYDYKKLVENRKNIK